MAYMIEGGGSKTLSKAKSWLYKYPEESKKLLQILTDSIVDYLLMQVKAGAQLLQVFESSAEYLGPELFSTFALPYIQEIATRLKQNNIVQSSVPLIIFAKGAHYALHQLSSAGYEVVGIDWTINPILARNFLGPDVTVQGNLDPCALYSNKEDLEKIVKKMCFEFGKSKYIANLGHGIYPDMDPESVKTLVETIHSF